MKNKIYFILIFFSIVASCDKREGINPCDTDYPENFPVVSTNEITFNDSSLIILFKIISIGNPEGEGITNYGICW